LKHHCIRIALVLTFAGAWLFACLPGSETSLPSTHEITITESSVGMNFSLHLDNDRFYVIYPTLNALSLNFVNLIYTANLETAQVSTDPCSLTVRDPTYLDRISYTPEIDVNFGRHLFLANGSTRHILYSDLEDEGSLVLKWLSTTDDDDAWWIDSLPGLNYPLIGRLDEDDEIRAVVADNGALSLYILDKDTDLRRISTTVFPSGDFLAQGDVSVVQQDDFWAFTAYDGSSKRLYLVQMKENELAAQAVYTEGEIHYSTIAEGRLLILIFEPLESTITLLDAKLIGDRALEQMAFEVIPVTLCEGTTSVFLAYHEDRRFFLFNERTTDQDDKRSYQLSLLYPTAKEAQYRKVPLVTGDVDIERFRGLQVGDCLFVLYLQDELRLLSLSLADISKED
jgi:hypothetical protein